jgi:hypothetical protein
MPAADAGENTSFGGTPMSTLSLWARRDPFADFDATFNSLVRNFLAPASAPTRVTPAGTSTTVRLSGLTGTMRSG